MAVKIRLQRIGKRDYPIYKIVAVDESEKRNGKYIELLGYFKPKDTDNQITLDKKALSVWLSKGAKMTEAVNRISGEIK